MVIVTKISRDPCMEERSLLWEGEGEKKRQLFPTKAPSASYKMYSSS